MLFALIPTLLVINFVPLNLEKLIVNRSSKFHNRKYWFDDLESDDKKEKFAVGYNPDSTLFLFVFDDRNNFLGQLNFEHRRFIAREAEPAVSLDVNQDGTKELFLFTRKKDSLFLNVFDYTRMRILRESRFVTMLGGYNSKEDFSLDGLGTYDVNGDSVPEIYFSITGGFSLSPRQLYRYDYMNDSLLASVNTGAPFERGEGIVSNGRFHILLPASANGNFDSGSHVPYLDTAAWIFGFDQDLQLTFDPFYLGSYPFNVQSMVYLDSKGYCMADSDSTDFSRLIRVSLDGRVEKGAYIRGQGGSKIYSVNTSGRDLHFINHIANSRTLLLDPGSIKLIPDRRVRHLSRKAPLLSEDVDNDGTADLVAVNYGDYVASLSTGRNLKHKVDIRLEAPAFYMVTANYYPELSRGELAFNSVIGTESFEYRKNPRFKLRYVIWFGIYMQSVGFVMLVLYYQRRRIEHRHALERQVADLQLQNIRNQLDPHFTFNALNSVGNAIYQENKEKAYDLFQRFTRMIRSSLMTSQQVFQSLQDEITFTTDYLEFQKTRFRDLFDYSFEIDPAVDLERTEIPRMLIQGYAENAVKHAFHGIGHKGEIRITISSSVRGVMIRIEDNGIGIHRSKELGATSGTLMGEHLLQEQINQIRKVYNCTIEVSVSDRAEAEMGASGTEVQIKLE